MLVAGGPKQTVATTTVLVLSPKPVSGKTQSNAKRSPSSASSQQRSYCLERPWKTELKSRHFLRVTGSSQHVANSRSACGSGDRASSRQPCPCWRYKLIAYHHHDVCVCVHAVNRRLASDTSWIILDVCIILYLCTYVCTYAWQHGDGTEWNLQTRCCDCATLIVRQRSQLRSRQNCAQLPRQLPRTWHKAFQPHLRSNHCMDKVCFHSWLNQKWTNWIMLFKNQHI